MNAHDELRALLELVPAPRSAGHESISAWDEPGTFDGLEVLASAATRARDVDDAWAGRREPYDTRITCALCGHGQPITVPFLNVTCRGCASSVLPGRCTTCHHISVVFSPEPQLSTTVRCDCGAGFLRPLLRLPAPRTTRVEQALGAVGTSTPLARRLTRGARGAALGAGLLGLLIGGSVLKAQLASDSPQRNAPSATVAQPVSDAPDAQGRAAAQDLVSAGRPVNVFACRAAVPDDIAPTNGAVTNPATVAFLEGCATE